MRKNVEKDNLTKIFKFFQFLQFLKLDPDQETQINADPCGSGSETLFSVFPEYSRIHHLCTQHLVSTILTKQRIKRGV
jgi:hypothetical protein